MRSLFSPTREESLAHLRAWYNTADAGRPDGRAGHLVPRIDDYRAFAAEHPEAASFERLNQLFGSFRDACREAGLPRLPAGAPARVTFKQAKESLRLAAVELGPAILREQYARWARNKIAAGEARIATKAEVLRFCGDWETAAQIGGFSPGRKHSWFTRSPKHLAEERNPEEREVIARLLAEVCRGYGRGVSSTEYKLETKGNPNLPPQEDVKAAFMSFGAGVRAAGFEPVRPLRA